MSYITYAGGAIMPVLVGAFESTRDSGNLVHDIDGGPDDVTFKAAGLRTGTLPLLFTEGAASRTAEEAHATGTVFTLVTDDASIAMSYVLAEGGRLSRRRERSGEWVLSVDFQEVKL